MVEIKEKSKCCGCTACKSICPQNAIKMIEDNEGFLYPEIDNEKCINCGACDKVCPVLNAKENKKEQIGYLVNNKNNEIRNDSTSGGAFTPIAEYVLDRNGVIFGATFDEDFNVIHKYVETKEGLKLFRGSKYVQSNLLDTFNETEKFLKENRVVCYSGTPCQIEGLKKFLRKDYDNLITVDLMCHAVPSPLVWRKYLEYQNKRLGGQKIQKVLFRDKSKYGYKYSTMTIKNEEKEYSRGVETDPYLRAFFGDLSDRPSCYECKFKKQYHESDFTIWDCFIVGELDKKLDDDNGTSRILINTDNGKKVFNEIKDSFIYSEIDVIKLTKNVKEMLHSVNMNPKRQQFFLEINKMSVESFFIKWFPNNIKVKIERNIRIFMIKTGLYTETKRIIKKILRK